MPHQLEKLLKEYCPPGELRSSASNLEHIFSIDNRLFSISGGSLEPFLLRSLHKGLRESLYLVERGREAASGSFGILQQKYNFF